MLRWYQSSVFAAPQRPLALCGMCTSPSLDLLPGHSRQCDLGQYRECRGAKATGSVFGSSTVGLVDMHQSSFCTRLQGCLHEMLGKNVYGLQRAGLPRVVDVAQCPPRMSAFQRSSKPGVQYAWFCVDCNWGELSTLPCVFAVVLAGAVRLYCGTHVRDNV